MTSERNDPPLGDKPADAPAGKPIEKPIEKPVDKPMGTTLEPTSAASKARAEPKTPQPDATPMESKPASTSPSKPASPPTPSLPSSPSRGMGFLGVLVLAVIVSGIVAGALIYFAPRWTPLLGLHPAPAPSAAPAPQAPAADPRVAELAARLDQLAARPAADPAQGATLRAQIGKLQDDLAKLAKEQEATADALAQVAGEIDDIKPGDAAPANEAMLQRLARLEQQMGELAAAVERLRALRGELDAMVGELGKMAERSARTDGRLSELEKAAAVQRDADRGAVDAARAAAIVSLGTRLRHAVAQGHDVAADLAALKTLAGEDAELTAPIEALAPRAESKLATPETLRQRFPAVAREIIAADATDQAGEWWEKALARLQNLVSIRRTGPDVTGEDAEARVAQAEAALAAGRLEQAVAALKPLAGQAAKAAAPWLADAEAVLAAQAAADRIVARGAALLSHTTGAPPATR
ncbi:MAG: mitofilin family membrane protein [Reyranellaceae bacterium]